MPQKTEAHIMLPLPLEVADQLVNGGRQELLGVQRDAVLARLEVRVQAGSEAHVTAPHFANSLHDPPPWDGQYSLGEPDAFRSCVEDEAPNDLLAILLAEAGDAPAVTARHAPTGLDLDW